MKRVTIMAIVVMLWASMALGITPTAFQRYNADWFSNATGSGRATGLLWMRSMELAVEAGEGQATGEQFYVDSGVTNAGDGSSWLNALETVEEAVALCEANRNDRINAAPGHAESFTAAAGAALGGFDLDKAGITLQGYGTGSDSPTFTFAHTDATVALGAANIRIKNVRFLAGYSEVAGAIQVEAGGDNCAIIGCEFPEPTTAAFEFDKAIVLASGADHFLVMGCLAYSVDQLGASSWIDMSTGVNNGTMIFDNVVIGDFDPAIVYSNKADLETQIDGGKYINWHADEYAFYFTGAATGYIDNVLVGTDVYTTAIEPGDGSLMVTGFRALWYDIDLGTDQTAAPLFTLAATGAWSFDLATNNLDHLMKVTTGVAADASLATYAPAGTLMSHLMSKAATTLEYDASMHSFEAIGDDADTILEDTAAIQPIVADLGGISEIGDKVVADMDANSTSLYWQEKTVSVTNVGFVSPVDNLFDVDGGPILISYFSGICTELIDSNVATAQIVCDADDTVDQQFSTAVAITDDVLGTVYVFTGVNPSVLTPLITGTTEGASNLMTPWVCKEGMIEQANNVANLDGTIVWYMTYRPLAAGITVTAQ